MRTSSAIPVELNRVYLPIWGFEREYETEYESGWFRDVTSFEFIVEALIAHSASQIALQSWGEERDVKLLDHLPKSLRKRIKFIDTDFSALRFAHLVFSPVFEEYHIKPFRPGSYALTIPEGLLNEPIQEDIFHSWILLPQFLLGLRYKLEVDIDIGQFRRALSAIRQKSRNPESRANMSILEGILGCYRLGKIEGLRITPSAVKEQEESFIRFLEDSDYEELSKANFGLGFPPHFKKYSTRIRHLVRRIVSNDRFPHIFEACSRPLSVATQVPMPSSDLVKTLVPSSYLPPIVSLEPALHEAREAWKHSVGDRERDVSEDD